jgi:hypothetical protein
MKDAMGNDLKVGDLVALSLERPLIYGRIVQLEEGGMIVGLKGGKAEMKPSLVVVASNHPIQVDPRVPIVGAILCLREDNPPPVEEEAKDKPVELTN